MGLETVVHISDLVASNPLAADSRSEGDDHIRNIKDALLRDFPNINAIVSVTPAELNYLDGATSNIQAQITAIIVGTIATLDDDNFTLRDNGTTTKKAQFQCSGISADTTRTFTFPDANMTLVGVDTTQTLTNKTLTSPSLTTPTLTSPVIAGTWSSYTTSTGKALVMGF
tara:strand:- start:242 stop:751 length:510 start_codon:yes stop_codon:yes gene_type:complete